MSYKPPWYATWSPARKGKVYKRRLNKARRKYAKALIGNPQAHARRLPHLEGEVNYRGT